MRHTGRHLSRHDKTTTMPVTRTISPLSHVHELDRALADSAKRPVLIFKHSPSYRISAQAYDEIASALDGSLADVYLVVVGTLVPFRTRLPKHLVEPAGLIRDTSHVEPFPHWGHRRDSLIHDSPRLARACRPSKL
jgi:monothiol bacilliredoxin BrxC